MNKRVFPTILIEVLVVIFYVVIVFIAPFTYNDVFWKNVIITICGLLTISAITDCFICKYVKEDETMYVVPIVKYSLIIGMLYIISSLLFIVSQIVPMWVQVVAYLIYIIVYSALIISVSLIKNKSVNKLEEVKLITNLNSEWIVRMNIIIKKSDNAELKANLEPLVSMLKHGEAISKPQLFEIEDKISKEISVIEELINNGKIDGAIIECSLLKDLLIERRELTLLYN